MGNTGPIIVDPQELDASRGGPSLRTRSIVIDPSELDATPGAPKTTPPIKPFDTSAGAIPSHTALSPGLTSQFEKPYTSVPGLFGQPELSEASKQRVAQERFEQGAHIGPGKTGVGGWLENLEADIRHGTGATAPGRVLSRMGAPGTESGVPPAVGETIGGPIIGPVRVARGLKQALGPYAGEPANVSSELRGLNEAIRGGMQTFAPALVTQPEALAAIPAYGAAGELAQRGLEKAGVSPEAAELTSNIALLGGGLAHGGIGEPRAPFGGVFERGATEPVVRGETVPDYLKGITDKTAAAVENARRLERINAPIAIPKLPETTAPPPILSRPTPRTPMEELSAQAAEARRPQEFRQQLTHEISEAIISRLRDEGLLEPSKTNIVDRRTVRPEDVEPYEPPRRFIGGEHIPPSVVPSAARIAPMLEARVTVNPQEVTRAAPPRMLPAAPPEAIEAEGQGEERYNAALARAQAYGQPQPRVAVEPATPQDITADSRRVANLSLGRFKNPIEKQYAQDVWQSMLGQGRVPVPPSGIGRSRADQIRDGLAEISKGNIAGRVPDPATRYAPDVLEEAQAMMAHTSDFLSQQQRPGRYFADMGEETSLTGRGPKVPITAVTSLRDQFPWFANLKESPSELARALERGEGPGYHRLLTAAADHITRTRAEMKTASLSVEPNLAQLAGDVGDLDPDLAKFLSDAAEGRISLWTQTKRDQLAKISEGIDNARAAIEFTRAVDALAQEERASNVPESPEGRRETGALGGPTSQRITPQESPELVQREEREGVLPGFGPALEEQRRAAGIEQGRRLTEEANRPPESIEGTAGEMERKSPLFRGTEASPQREIFPPRGDKGFVTPGLLRDFLSGKITKEAYQRFVAEPLIEKGLGIGDKYAKVRDADPEIAAGLHLLDNAPAYFRAKTTHTIHDMIGGLSRDQERLFTLMADADSRENLRTNHPQEFRQATSDPAIQEALRKYRPIEQQLTAARQRMGGATLDRDYLRRIYDQHIAGIGQAEAPGASERATTAFDRVIQPQRLGNMSREATAEYHYEHGLHEFGPSFGTKFLATNLRALEDRVARDFIGKATEIKPGDPEPRFITYEGERYYRPDIAREMRDAGQKNVEVYERYDPTAGVKFPQQGTGRFLGPQEIVRALNDYGARRDSPAGPLRRFFQEQILGFGFGIPHVANILRRVTQSVPLGAANPVGWARAWQVAFGKELRERGVRGLDDPTFDRLLQQGAITTGGAANLKRYWGGNLNPANWARSLAGIGHKVIFDPNSFGGFGGVDQRARLYVADLVKSQNPGMSDPEIARAVNTQLGDYNRANWTDRQKMLGKFMMFPGWDASSMRWVIQHPIKTTVPPALLVWTANQILNRYGYNRGDEASDISNIHFGDRSIGLTILRESMGRNLTRSAFNYAQSRIRGETGQRPLAEFARGFTQGAGGLVGTMRPDITLALDVAMNRQSPFGAKELIDRGDWNQPGRVLPNLALEKFAAITVRHALPQLDRLLDSNEETDLRSFAGGNVGVPNYKSGAEQRLKRNVAESMEVSQTLSRLAKTKPEMARDFIRDPDNAAYALFRTELGRMGSTLKRMDDAKEAVNSAKNLSAEEKREHLATIEHARENLLKNADGLDRLLFERKQENRWHRMHGPGTAPQPGSWQRLSSEARP